MLNLKWDLLPVNFATNVGWTRGPSEKVKRCAASKLRYLMSVFIVYRLDIRRQDALGVLMS